MCKYGRRSIVLQTRLNDFMRMHCGSVDSPQKQRVVSNKPVLVVGPQHEEFLTLLLRQLQMKPVAYRTAGGEDRAGFA